MLGKAQELFEKLGGTMAESVGVRAGESIRPEVKAGTKAPPVADFVRDRSVGDIELEKVIPDPDQPRREFDAEQLQQLAEDLKSRGQLQPIRVRWNSGRGKWMIISGERRYRAAKLAGLPKIKAMFVDRELTENELRSEQLVENLLRENLNSMEEARSFKSLMEINGWNATELAASIHVSKAKVSRALKLLELPADLQAKVEAGTLPATTAYEVAKVKDAGEQRTLAEQGQTLAETARVVKAQAVGGVNRKKPTNECFRLADGVRVQVTSRRHLGDEGVRDALLEAAGLVFQRSKGRKAA